MAWALLEGVKVHGRWWTETLGGILEGPMGAWIGGQLMDVWKECSYVWTDVVNGSSGCRTDGWTNGVVVVLGDTYEWMV